MLYNKLEINGQLTKIGELKHTTSGKAYINGYLKNFTAKDGKHTDFANIGFVAFEQAAEELGSMALQKDECVVLRGSLRDNTYKDKTIAQLIVTSSAVSTDRYAYMKKATQESYTPQQTKPERAKVNTVGEVALENPYAKKDDSPF